MPFHWVYLSKPALHSSIAPAGSVQISKRYHLFFFSIKKEAGEFHLLCENFNLMLVNIICYCIRRLFFILLSVI